MSWNCYQCGRLLKPLTVKARLKDCMDYHETDALLYKGYEAAFHECEGCGAEYLQYAYVAAVERPER